MFAFLKIFGTIRVMGIGINDMLTCIMEKQNLDSVMMAHHQNHAFSLVELAISLIIISLLIAGATSGRRMIQVSQAMKLGRELDNLRVATATFYEKYSSYPGDYERASIMMNGSQFGLTVLNGNGDGYIGYMPADISVAESWAFLTDESKAGENKGFFVQLIASKVLTLASLEEPGVWDEMQHHLAVWKPWRDAYAGSGSSDPLNNGNSYKYGYARSKGFKHVLLVPKVDRYDITGGDGSVSSNIANINTLTLVSVAEVDSVRKGNSLNLINLTSVLEAKMLSKVRNGVEGDNCISGDCLISGTGYVRTFDTREYQGDSAANDCLLVRAGVSDASKATYVNNLPEARKCTISVAITVDPNDAYRMPSRPALRSYTAPSGSDN